MGTASSAPGRQSGLASETPEKQLGMMQALGRQLVLVTQGMGS